MEPGNVDAMTWVTLLGFVGTTVVVLITMSYRVGRTEMAIQKKIAETQAAGDKHVDTEVGLLRKEFKETADINSRSMGESLAAIRTRTDMIETEMRRTTSDAAIWNRDNFVRREDFRDAVDTINRNVNEVRTTILDSMKRLEEKLERIRERPNGCVNWQSKQE
jgi:hypothetical protein